MAVIDEVVVGATKPPLIAFWEDENGMPISLLNGSARLQGRCDSMPGVQIDSLGSLTDPQQGEATFNSLGTLVSQAQLDAAGLMEATFNLRVKFTDAAGKFDWSEAIFIKWVRTPISVVAVLYNLARQKILDGTLDLAGDTLKFMLLKPEYVPDLDHVSVTPLAAQELSGTGYTGGFGGSGRKTMANKTFGVNHSTDRGFMDCDDPSWAGINAGTIGCIAIVKEITDDSLSLPIAYIDVADFLTNGGTYSHVVPAEGILTF